MTSLTNDKALEQAKAAYLNFAGSNAIAFEDLPEPIRSDWFTTVALTQLYLDNPEIANPTPSGGHAARCAWEIQAGVIPGTANPEASITIGLTSEEFEQNGDRFFYKGMQALNEVKRRLDPARLNWVRMDWIWF